MALENYEYDGARFSVGANDPKTNFGLLIQIHNPWSMTNRTVARLLAEIEEGSDPSELEFRHDDELRPALRAIVRKKLIRALGKTERKDVEIPHIKPASELPEERKVQELYDRVVQDLKTQAGDPVDGQYVIYDTRLGALHSILRKTDIIFASNENILNFVLKKLIESEEFVFLPPLPASRVDASI